MMYRKEIQLPPFSRGFHLITDIVARELRNVPESGILNLFIQHTSAALTINENADPDVRRDLESFFNKLVPENLPLYTHTLEGPDDMPAHIKSSLFSVSLSIPVTNGRMCLGNWQGIYLCEFRNNAGSRKIVLTLNY